jgi:membrane fusion protein (multidrug efflux system)
MTQADGQATPSALPIPASSKVMGAVSRVAVVVFAILSVWLIASEWTSWTGNATYQTTDDAYLQSDITPIGAKVPGYVRKVPIEDYQTVKAGALLVELVDDDYRAQVAQAVASVATAEATIGTLGAQRRLQAANVAAAEAVVKATRASLDRNRREAHRQHVLEATGSGTPQAVDQTDTLAIQTEAQLEQNQAQLEAARRQLDVLDAQVAQAKATLEAQQAALDLARINLGYTRIVAPTDGELGQRLVRAGQYLGVGQQVAQLVALPHVWVTANYKETQLTRVAIGQAAELRIDTFPGTVLHGHVEAFAPASGSQFALLPPDNATGNFTKVVQRIAVKIAIDDAAGIGARLRPGMSVVATIDTGARPAAPPKQP